MFRKGHRSERLRVTSLMTVVFFFSAPGIKALEIVVSNLEPGTLKRLQVPPLERIRIGIGRPNFVSPTW